MAAKGMDRLRERWERITPREQKLVKLLGATAVGIVLALVGFSINDGLHAREVKNDQTRRALALLRDVRAAGAQRDLDMPHVKIPDEPVELESYLEEIGKEVGVAIPGYSPRPKATKGKFTEVSTRIEIRGINILELKDLLEKIESKSKVVVVTNLHIKRHFREEDKLDADMVVSTFYREAGKTEGGGDSSKKSGKEG